MIRMRNVALPAVMLALLAGGCADFLTGPGISTNPNVPTTATASTLWIGAETSLSLNWDNWNFPRFPAWAGQFAGALFTWQSMANYSAGTQAGEANDIWNATYGPGGLRDLRAVEADVAAAQNFKFRGQARVLEALYMGTAADLFGSVPYSTALTARPTFDSQTVVYSHVLALLDSAIADLDGTGDGSGNADYFYANDFAKWKAAAHTLRARFLMHTARTSATAYDLSVLARVAADAAAGIGSLDGELRFLHSGVQNATLGVNGFYGWTKSLIVQPAALHIALMREAGESALLPAFYVPNPSAGGQFVGTTPGQPGAQDSISSFVIQATTPTYIVTFVEDQMLLAEAQYRLGNPVAARTVLNAYRASIGVGPLALSGDSLLVAILREKFIHDFINIEAWNDYLRTCYPNIDLPVNAALDYVPARLPVAQSEVIANSANVPPQPDGNPGNANDPKNDFATDRVTACYGQVKRLN